MVTIIGLGLNGGDLSMRAAEAMRAAKSVLLSTAYPPVAEGLKAAGIAFETLDPLYERSRNYDTLAKNIAREVRRRAKEGDVCYCVPGAVTEDRAAQLLLGKNVRVIEGVGKAASAAAKAGLFGKYMSVSAYEAEGSKLALPLVVYDIADRELAGDVKLLLAEKFGDEAPCAYINGETLLKIPLYEADRQKSYGAGCALAVYDTPLLEKKRFDLEDFLAILRLLRAPDGCPWDRAQTHESIRINAVEEAYELVDAIDKDDPDKIREEAGDVLMQAAFHTLMEEERGNFDMTDVLTEACLKLISRHTHVFGKDKAASADGALSVWDRNKMTEKHQATYSDAVNDVPECFPALLRAQKIAKRVAKGGWDFCSRENIEKKLREEYAELMAAVASGDKAAVSNELGDVLMCMAWLGRYVGADCEQALLDAVKKVQMRYTAFETLVLADGKDPNSLTDEEWREYYRRAKDDTRA